MKSVYKELRKKIGTQESVADLLGVSRITIIRREQGHSRITNEHLNALRTMISERQDCNVTVGHLSKKEGFQMAKVDLNRMLTVSNSGLTYADDYKTFVVRDGELFKEMVAIAME